MARINHTNYLDVVDTVWSAAKEKGIMHINSQEDSYDGKSFKIRGEDLINFGTCGYLGLETHPKLIEGSIELTKKYGTQLSMSRAYMRPPYIQELEELMSEIFDNNKVICYTSTSNAHISVIANIIKPRDLIILDQQVHFSVQFPCKNAKLTGTTVKMIRHSDWDALDQLVAEEANNYDRIWYMADGVYSMHGDLPDTDRLDGLMKKHKKLHLYFDDAHGMGWSGKNGAGYVYDRLGVNERIVVISTLAKGFGCVGGTAVFYDPEMFRKVDIFGGPLSYSHPLSPSNVGAAIASAKIHLSPEIYEYQNHLGDLMAYMDQGLREMNLPNLSAPNSPIYYIGSGLNKVTRNFVHRILNEGIYVNTATFPVVANDRSGLRFTLTRHNTKEDIDKLVEGMAKHLPLAIEEEGDDIGRVYEEFGFEYKGNDKRISKTKTGIKVETYSSINEIDQKLWDTALKDRGNITHEALVCIEEVFRGNEEKECNWDFHYLIIKDENDKLLCATFFTSGWYKDDMLSPENVSEQIEQRRKEDKYFLCSKTLAMGCLFSEGDFLFIEKDSLHFNEVVKALFSFVSKTKNEVSASTVIFRDFEEDSPLFNIMEGEGFIKLQMPNTNRVENPYWESEDELLSMISSKNNKNNIKRYALRLRDLFEVEIKEEVSDELADEYFKLFENVKDKNFGFNFFKYPRKITNVISKHKNWEFIEIRLKESNKIVAAIWSYKGDDHYCPLIIGMDYEYSYSHRLYQQSMYRVVKRGNDLRKSKTYLGLSADFEKQKYNAKQIPIYAFIKVDDTFNLELIESFSNVKKQLS